MRPDTQPPLDPNTNKPVEDAKERIEYLIQRLDEDGTKIIIPTPAISEIMVRAGTAASQYLDILNRHAVFKVEPFDERAAIEVAAMTREALEGGNKRGGGDGTWNKIKYDRQIIAISRVAGATTIYTDDENLKNFAARVEMQAIGVWELPLPPVDPQLSLELSENGQNEDDIENPEEGL